MLQHIICILIVPVSLKSLRWWELYRSAVEKHRMIMISYRRSSSRAAIIISTGLSPDPHQLSILAFWDSAAARFHTDETLAAGRKTREGMSDGSKHEGIMWARAALATCQDSCVGCVFSCFLNETSCRPVFRAARCGLICILSPALKERGVCEISCTTVTLDAWYGTSEELYLNFSLFFLQHLNVGGLSFSKKRLLLMSIMAQWHFINITHFKKYFLFECCSSK